MHGERVPVVGNLGSIILDGTDADSALQPSHPLLRLSRSLLYTIGRAFLRDWPDLLLHGTRTVTWLTKVLQWDVWFVFRA